MVRPRVRQQQQKDVRVRRARRLQKNEEEEANDQQVKHDDGERRNIRRLLVDFVGRALYAGLEGCEGESEKKKANRISNNDDERSGQTYIIGDATRPRTE